MEKKVIHPVWFRVTHWINVIAIFILIFSGWRIYNASPLFDFFFPREYTLGGWLGGALQWHFAAMWLFVINALVYLSLNLFTRRFKIKLWPISIRQAVNEMKMAVCGKLKHHDLSQYNMVQKLAYVSILLNGLVIVVSGLVLWKSVQFPTLRLLIGGYENARLVHFYSMSFFCSFILVHVVMVILTPKTLLAMIRGR